jgi:hypothetical protein
MAVLAAGWWGDFIGWLEGHEASALVLAAFLTFSATVILAVVTAFYAGSARRQAGANVKMAEEMLQQRLIGVQPIVVPSAVSVGHWEVEARVSNVGNGPSFELAVLLESLTENRQVDEVHEMQVLKAGEDRGVRFQPREVFEEKWDDDLKRNTRVFPVGRYRLVAAYRDLYGNALSAVRPLELFELDTQRGVRLDAHLGEIQFSGYDVQPSGEARQ